MDIAFGPYVFFSKTLTVIIENRSFFRFDRKKPCRHASCTFLGNFPALESCPACSQNFAHGMRHGFYSVHKLTVRDFFLQLARSVFLKHNGTRAHILHVLTMVVIMRADYTRPRTAATRPGATCLCGLYLYCVYPCVPVGGYRSRRGHRAKAVVKAAAGRERNNTYAMMNFSFWPNDSALFSQVYNQYTLRITHTRNVYDNIYIYI